jgi:hypothetical protein
VNKDLIQRKEAEMKDTVLSEKDTASYTKWLKFAKVRLIEENLHILDVEKRNNNLQGPSILAEAPNEETIVVEKKVIPEKSKEGEKGSDN